MHRFQTLPSFSTSATQAAPLQLGALYAEPDPMAGGLAQSWTEAATLYTQSADQGRAMQVDPIKPTLKAPGTKILNLKYYKLLSGFAYKANLRRYTKATRMECSALACATWWGGIKFRIGMRLVSALETKM
jgi:hypothetical protein